jgi:hypothetical protein
MESWNGGIKGNTLTCMKKHPAIQKGIVVYNSSKLSAFREEIATEWGE